MKTIRKEVDGIGYQLVRNEFYGSIWYREGGKKCWKYLQGGAAQDMVKVYEGL